MMFSSLYRFLQHRYPSHYTLTFESMYSGYLTIQDTGVMHSPTPVSLTLDSVLCDLLTDFDMLVIIASGLSLF